MKPSHAIFLVALLFPLASVAETAMVSGLQVNFAAPTGYCIAKGIPGESPPLKRVRQQFEATMQVLAIYLPCDAMRSLLTESRSPDSLPEFGVIAVAKTSGVVIRMSGVTRTQFIESKRDSLTRQHGSARRSREKGLAQGTADLKIEGKLDGGLTDFGVVDADKNAVYTATALSQTSPSGAPAARVLAVTSITLIRGFQTWVMHYKLERDEADLDAVLRLQKSLLSAIVGAN